MRECGKGVFWNIGMKHEERQACRQVCAYLASVCVSGIRL